MSQSSTNPVGSSDSGRLIPLAAATQHLAAEPLPLTEEEKLALRLRIGSLVDEYDPARPNVYDEIMRATRRTEQPIDDRTAGDRRPAETAPSHLSFRRNLERRTWGQRNARSVDSCFGTISVCG
eukprot:Gregarina_sp_Poly_1__2036@NODE_1535_length_3909_cov_331_545549_g1012_i0_p6_GENE_NODE_1535_length_3909_cov_331_545549_g1012_i0NODE_1535_length_3909_cov_331_545549_g1012_i0_p6_ORF_typecomplete_len124_score12_10_NODE_1535_length_3909_cov_331_545549_g1012_i028693240